MEDRNANRNNGSQCLLWWYLKRKRSLWDEISEVRKGHPIKLWCAARDFNSIRSVGERRGQSSNVNYSSEIRSFNNFIENSRLIDIPLVGRSLLGINLIGQLKA